MIKVITKTGFEIEVDETVLNDMEVVDAIAMCDSENEFEKVKGVSILSTKIFGKDKKKVYDHVRTEDGRVPTDAIEKEILDIFDAIGKAGKN